MTDAVLWC